MILLVKLIYNVWNNVYLECLNIKLVEFLKYFKKKSFQKGAEDHAYSPICGANKNGSYLHYMLNNDIL